MNIQSNIQYVSTFLFLFFVLFSFQNSPLFCPINYIYYLYQLLYIIYLSLLSFILICDSYRCIKMTLTTYKFNCNIYIQYLRICCLKCVLLQFMKNIYYKTHCILIYYSKLCSSSFIKNLQLLDQIVRSVSDYLFNFS